MAAVEPSGSIFKWVIKLLRALLNPSAIKNNTRINAINSKRAMCDFQVSFSNMVFESAKMHENFKLLGFGEKDQKEAYQELRNRTYRNAEIIYNSALENLVDNLKSMHISKTSPRVGVYVFENSYEKVRCIHSLPELKNNDAKETSKYTVLNHIIEEGTPYLCNNIPREICENPKYLHESFDLEAIRKHYPRKRLLSRKIIHRYLLLIGNLLKINLVKKDKIWARHSKLDINDRNNKDRKGMYQSHLGIPITYRWHAKKGALNDCLSEVFSLNGEDECKAILGVILIDHPEPHYFDESAKDEFKENIDVNTSYIYADMVSTALAMLTSIEKSQAVTNYEKLINV